MNDQVPFLIRVQHAFANLVKRVISIGAAIVWPIEWAWMTFLGSVIALHDRFENVESLFREAGRVLVLPFRLGWRFIVSLTASLFPSSARNAIAALWHKIAWAAGFILGLLMRGAERLNLDGILFRATQLSKPIWYPMVAVGMFCFFWAATRPYKKLLWSLPLLLLAVPILTAAVWGASFGKSTIAAQYRAALDRSLEERDYSRAQLLERKLASLDIEMPMALYNSGLALEQAGKITEAYERMQQLASPNTPGYPLAHFWIAQHLLMGKLELATAEAHRLADDHLKQLAVLAIRGPAINMMRAELLIQENKLEQASELLKPLVHDNSSAAIERFRMDLELNQPEQALEDAREVCEHMQRFGKTAQPVTNHDYETWANAEQILQHDAEFRAVLHNWLADHPESAGARKSVAALCAKDLDRLLRSSTPEPKELADRLRNLIELADETENVRGRVALLYQQRSARPDIRELFEILAKTEDKSSALAEALGTAASVSGEWDRAEVYLEDAVRKDATNAVAWNNLACVLLERENGSIEHALFAVNKALALKPGDYNYRETRGEAFLRQHRWHEAVDDLEYAANGMPESPIVHRALYKAYTGLGKNELATAHAQYAN
jgi:tetratricopeptide (TPR) repeat protein